MIDPARQRWYRATAIFGIACYMYASGCRAEQAAPLPTMVTADAAQLEPIQENAAPTNATFSDAKQTGVLQMASLTPLRTSEPAPTLPLPPTAPPEQDTTNPALVDEAQSVNPENSVYATALADGVTTGLALSAGAVEMNPLIVTSPMGLLAVTGIKIGLVKYANTLPQQDKRAVLKTSSALWGGAAANNLMVLMAVPSPAAVVAGVVVGMLIWNHMEGQYQEQDRLMAARGVKPPEVTSSIETASNAAPLPIF